MATYKKAPPKKGTSKGNGGSYSKKPGQSYEQAMKECLATGKSHSACSKACRGM